MKKTPVVQIFYGCLFALGLMQVAHTQTRTNQPQNKVHPQATSSQSPGAAVFRENIESIVLIEAEDSEGKRQGSGVAFRNGFSRNEEGKIVRNSTWIVTNAHVVKKTKTVKVMVSGFPVKGEVMYSDAQMDVAFVFVNDTVIKPVELINAPTLVSPGDAVFAIGAPQGLTRSITDGIVSATREIDGIRLIQTSAAISPGSSGGGLFRTTGELIGITTFKILGGESLNFAIEISQIGTLFDAYNAAEMMKILIAPKYLPVFGDGFVKWVFSARGKTGGTILDEYKEAEERWSKNDLPLEKWDEKQFEIANRYYIFVESTKTTDSSQSTNSGGSSSNKLVLICQLSAGNTQRTESFEIDYSEGTIKGYPAKITPNSMEYSFKNREGTEYTLFFDRNASTLTISTERFPRLLHGKCSRSEGRAF